MLHKMRISVKLAIVYAIFLFISSIAIFLLFAGIRRRESMDYAKALSAQTLNTVGRNVTTLIDNAAYYSRIILSSSEVTEALAAGNGERQRESLYQFISLVDSETHINGIYMWDMNEHACSIDRNHVRSLRTEKVSETNWYDEVMELGGSYCLKLNADRVLTQSSAETSVSLIRVINNPVDYQPVGILMINIDLDAFRGCYESVEEKSVPSLYILDRTGKIVASRSHITLPEFRLALASEKESVTYEDKRIFPDSLTVDGIDWQILVGTVIENSLDESAVGGFLAVLAMTFLAAFCFADYLFIKRYVASPLEDMADSMNRMEGKRFEKIYTDSRGAEFFAEMEILKDTYNEMVDEIDDLIEQVYEEEKIKRKTELNVLQEQMKPHFLYNTIDAMGYLALSGKSQEVYDALEAFGSYYRILLSKGKELITVREEIEMVRDYLELLKIRYGDEMHYVLDVDENICDNYMLKVEVLTMQGGAYMRWMANSLLVSGVNTILVILVAAMAGYAFAKRKFPGRSVLLNIVIATQIIPSVTTLIPLFLIVSKLGWVNTYKSLIFPGVANAFGVYMMTQFMKDIPDSLLEAATIDGCGEYGNFFKIVMPITVPQLSLLAIFNFTNQWGSLTWPLITVNETMMKTLPLGIASMKDLNGTLTGTIMAASMISFIPLLIAFIFASDKFIEGMTLGAVKG